MRATTCGTFAARGAGANLCRDRLAQTRESAPVIDLGDGRPAIKDLRGTASHDIDYYAWEAVRIIMIARKVVKAGLRGAAAVELALAAVDREAPHLKTFRDQVTHVEDNRGADDVVYFTEAVRLRPGGGVEYVVDPRYRHHDVLGALVEAAETALLTLAPEAAGLPRHDPRA